MEKNGITSCIKNLDKKERIIIISAVILFAAIITGLSIKKNNEIILQGEIKVKEVEVFPKIQGTVENININEGSSIKKGDILATVILNEKEKMRGEIELQEAIEREEAYNQQAQEQKIEIAKMRVAEAETTLRNANKNYTWAKGAFEKGKLEKEKYKNAESQYKRAQNALSAAQSNLMMYVSTMQSKKSTALNSNIYEITSPIEGEVAEIHVKAGEYLTLNTPIATLIDPKNITVRFELREDLLSKFKDGKTFFAKVPATGHKKTEFMTTFINPLNKMTTYENKNLKNDGTFKTFEVQAIPIGDTSQLKNGMSVLINWSMMK